VSAACRERDEAGRYVPVSVAPETKTCPRCEETKPIEEFAPRGGSRPAHHRQSFCRSCAAARGREWEKENPERTAERQRKYRLRREFGLTPEEYDAMFKAQGGVCAVCEQPQLGDIKNLAVDHNHETGEVRGLLCNRCNPALAILDDPAWLAAALAYVEAHR
jgi:hypothetical protein